MTLTKKKMVSEIALRTRLPIAEVQSMLDCLIETWVEELRSGGRIELENVFILDTYVNRNLNSEGMMQNEAVIHSKNNEGRRLTLRTSKQLRRLLNEHF